MELFCKCFPILLYVWLVISCDSIESLFDCIVESNEYFIFVQNIFVCNDFTQMPRVHTIDTMIERNRILNRIEFTSNGLMYAIVFKEKNFSLAFRIFIKSILCANSRSLWLFLSFSKFEHQYHHHYHHRHREQMHVRNSTGDSAIAILHSTP